MLEGSWEQFINPVEDVPSAEMPTEEDEVHPTYSCIRMLCGKQGSTTVGKNALSAAPNNRQQHFLRKKCSQVFAYHQKKEYFLLDLQYWQYQKRFFFSFFFFLFFPPSMTGIAHDILEMWMPKIQSFLSCSLTQGEFPLHFYPESEPWLQPPHTAKPCGGGLSQSEFSKGCR